MNDCKKCIAQYLVKGKHSLLAGISNSTRNDCVVSHHIDGVHLYIF